MTWPKTNAKDIRKEKKQMTKPYKGWSGDCLVKLSECMCYDYVVYNGIVDCRVGRKVKGGRMLRPVNGCTPEFFVSDAEVVNRNWWLNLSRRH